MMDINRLNIQNRLSDITDDLHVIIDSCKPICEENIPEEEDSIWCARAIKNIAHLISLSSVLLTKLELEKDGLMAVLQKYMQDNGVEGFSAEDITIKLKNNPARVVVNDESVIGKCYYNEETVTKLNKPLIAEHIKKGWTVIGCELVQDRRLEIKYNPVKAKEHA